ncbi:MAG: hypothetical protein ACREXT_14885 [Gammaproteobacteria bacterium]
MMFDQFTRRAAIAVAVVAVVTAFYSGRVLFVFAALVLYSLVTS